jgi:preprotein translocase subunit SecY
VVEALRNAFRVPDLRKRILFTLAMLAVYRFGAHVPVPGIDPAAIRAAVNQGSVLGFLDLFSGGALSRFAIFALGIMPYITASIIMQLLTVVIPTLEKWQKEGEAGQKRIIQWTRYGTLALAVIQSVGYIAFFQAQLRTNFPLLTKFLIVVTLTAGTAVIMWLGELITQRGVGNGMSLLIFTSIIARFPIAVYTTASTINPILVVLLVIIFVAIIMAVVTMEGGQRRVPVQYAKRVVGRKMYGGQQTYIPLKVNTAGVIPIIFASSILFFPSQIATFFPANRVAKSIAGFVSSQSPGFVIAESILIVFFAYFYTAIVFNPLDLADNIKKYGGFIPGVRPGRPTAEFLDSVLNRITLPGGIFLAAIAALPTVLFGMMNAPFFQYFGGTSLLIMVSVSLETMKQIETQLLMRHYDGFFK